MKFLLISLGLLLATSSALAVEQSQTTKDEATETDRRNADPWFALELSASPVGLGNSSVSTGSPATYNSLPLSLQADWIPIHKYGLWSIGGTADYYFVTNTDGSTNYLPSYAYFLGGQVKYQAKFVDHQIIVPVVGYTAGSWSYKNNNGGAGYFLAQGPMLGAWVLLNGIDGAVAQSAWTDLGIRRSYLVLEVRNLSGSDSTATISGQTYHIGIRFEL